MKTAGMKNRLFNHLLIPLMFSALLVAWAKSCQALEYMSFDQFPATKSDEVPADGGTWKYMSSHTSEPGWTSTSCGYHSTIAYPGHSSVYDFFSWYVNGYNSDHMGWTTHGYLEIDGTEATRGHSLKLTTTGGINSGGQAGVPLFNKESYLAELQSGNPASGTQVGHPTLYFMNTSLSHAKVPMFQAQGANRLSFYFKLPDTVSNGEGGSGKPVRATTSIGPFNDVGGHWYHSTYNRGGGWTHVLVDGHPQHNNAYHNASLYPYPSSSMRDFDVDYFNTFHTWYMTFLPYSGVAVTPYRIWMDEIEFYHDSEPQNNETIATPAVTYFPESHLFEISFSDKYKNNANSYSTYEVRYSFEQISNGNWDQATPVHIQADGRFHIQERSDGTFQKWWPYYQAVWAPFKILGVDESRLVPGTRIYFAIKDVSQKQDDPRVPRDGINGYWSERRGGRSYDLYPERFDYDGDRPVLGLIKRIDFLLPLPGQFVPDLHVANAVPEKYNLLPGGQYSAAISVGNVGNAPATSTNMRLYLSHDIRVSATDNLLGEITLQPLGAKGSVSHALSFNAPQEKGDYYIGGCVDTVQGEVDATNNCGLGVKVSVGPAFHWQLVLPAIQGNREKESDSTP